MLNSFLIKSIESCAEIFFILSYAVLKCLRVLLLKDKSICFIGDNYHSFHALSEALKKNKWLAKTVKNSSDYTYGTLYDVDLNKASVFGKIHFYFNIIIFFDMVYFYHDFKITHHPVLCYFLHVKYLKRYGIKVGYSGSGCKDGALQNEVMAASSELCRRCNWINYPEVCSNNVNQRKINDILRYSNIYSCEIELPATLRRSEIAFPLPLTGTVNFNFLKIDGDTPSTYKIKKKKDHLLVLTAFAGESIRLNERFDIKGKKLILKAIENLVKKGYKLQHVHISDVPSADVKYYIQQCDIVVDQLFYGTLGDFARQCLFFGKIVLTNISPLLIKENYAIQECPVIHVNENNLTDKIIYILHCDSEEINSLQRSCKNWIEKWYSPSACAKRFDVVYNRLKENKIPFDKDVISDYE